MTGKVNRKVLISCVAAGGLFLLFAFTAIGSSREMESLFLHVFGGVDTMDAGSLLMVLIQKGIPVIFFLYLFSTSFQQDFLISYVYVFSRLDKRSAWLRRKTSFFCLQIFVAWLLVFLFVGLIGALFGLKLTVQLSFLAPLFLSNALSVLALAYAQNCLSIWLGATKSFFLIVALICLSYVFGILTVSIPFCTQFLYYFFPSINGMYLWHEGAFYSQEYWMKLEIPGFVFWKSFLACLLWLGLTYGITAYKLKRCDLLDIGKGG